MLAAVSAFGLLLMTLFGVMMSVMRRWRRLKRDGGSSEAAGYGFQLDDLVKLLCYTGWRRRRRGTPGRAGAKPGHTGTASQMVPDDAELVQLALRSQSTGAGLMQENENYSSASDINARGTSTSSSHGTVSQCGTVVPTLL